MRSFGTRTTVLLLATALVALPCGARAKNGLATPASSQTTRQQSARTAAPQEDKGVETAIIAGIVSLVVGLASGLGTLLLSERSLRAQYQLEFAAERVARKLLKDKEWKLRTFEVISKHLAGFKEDELRKILVRAGAVRFLARDGEELWGLLERNKDRLGAIQVDQSPQTRTVLTGGGGGGGGMRVLQQEYKEPF